MSMTPERFLRLRRLSAVPRWAVVPTIRPQNVAEHSFHVCTMALWLAERYAPVQAGSVSRERLMMAALYHDEAEAITGDIAAPAKRWMDRDRLKELESELGVGEFEDEGHIANLIKLADCLEAWVYLKEEQELGNRQGIKLVIEDLDKSIQGAWSKFVFAEEMFECSLAELKDDLWFSLHSSRHPCMEQV